MIPCSCAGDEAGAIGLTRNRVSSLPKSGDLPPGARATAAARNSISMGRAVVVGARCSSHPRRSGTVPRDVPNESRCLGFSLVNGFTA